MSSSRPVRLLVIQLTRLGDTLQSLMALRAAKQLYPRLEIHFVARERFAAAAKRVPWLEGVVALPTEKILLPVLQSRKNGESRTVQEAARWLGPLVKHPWDLVVNWSYSESSSFLTGIVPGRVKLGYSRTVEQNRDGARQTKLTCPDGWSHYVQAVVQGGVHQNIHLTDVLTTQLLTALQIHFGEPADNGDAPVTSKSFFSLKPHTMADHDLGPRWRDRTKKWIAIQLGAGQAEKTWDPENWAELAREILCGHSEYGVILLGGKEDQERADAFRGRLPGLGYDPSAVVSVVGQSDFDLWASVVSRCQWLFSCDTAAVHLASVLGTRVLNVSVGPVRWTETGPYGNGHFVVASNTPCPACQDRDSGLVHACSKAVTPAAVYGAWSFAAHDAMFRNQTTLEHHFARLGVRSELDRVRIFRSRIRGATDGGGVVYDPLTSHPMQLSDWTAMVMGHIARAWYCGWVPPVGQELSRPRISPELVKKLRELDEASQVLSKVCEEATRTASTLNKRGSRLRSDKIMKIHDRDEIKGLGKQLQDLDSLIERLGEAQAPLHAFSQMARVLMHNLRGAQIAELGREGAACYQQLGEGVGILREWIKFTLNLAKPVAIKIEPLALVERL